MNLTMAWMENERAVTGQRRPDSTWRDGAAKADTASRDWSLTSHSTLLWRVRRKKLGTTRTQGDQQAPRPVYDKDDFEYIGISSGLDTRAGCKFSSNGKGTGCREATFHSLLPWIDGDWMSPGGNMGGEAH